MVVRSHCHSEANSWCRPRLRVTDASDAAAPVPCNTFAGDRLAKIMDGKRTLLHANHGIIVCTETVAEAFDYLYYLEKAGEITVKAMSMGRPLQLIPKQVCEQFHTEMEPPHLVKVYTVCGLHTFCTCTLSLFALPLVLCSTSLHVVLPLHGRFAVLVRVSYICFLI